MPQVLRDCLCPAGGHARALAKAEHLAAQLESACLTRKSSGAQRPSGLPQQRDVPADLMQELSKCLCSGSCASNRLTDLRKLQVEARRAVA